MLGARPLFTGISDKRTNGRQTHPIGTFLFLLLRSPINVHFERQLSAIGKFQRPVDFVSRPPTPSPPNAASVPLVESSLRIVFTKRPGTCFQFLHKIFFCATQKRISYYFPGIHALTLLPPSTSNYRPVHCHCRSVELIHNSEVSSCDQGGVSSVPKDQLINRRPSSSLQTHPAFSSDTLSEEFSVRTFNIHLNLD